MGDVVTSAANCCGLALRLEGSGRWNIVFVFLQKRGVTTLLVTALGLLEGGEEETGIGVALLLRSGGTAGCPMGVSLAVGLWCSVLGEVLSEAVVLFEV